MSALSSRRRSLFGTIIADPYRKLAAIDNPHWRQSFATVRKCFEERDIITCCFNSQDKPALIVHLERGRPHRVLDAGSQLSLTQVIAHFVLIFAVKLATEERCHVLGFHRMYRCSYDVLVNRREIFLAPEHHVCAVLHSTCITVHR